jgi:HlyD family secretion protein
MGITMRAFSWRVSVPALLALLLLSAIVLWRVFMPTRVDATTLSHAVPLLRTLQFSARVKTPARVELGATLTARVARVRVKEGDIFAVGDPLIDLEADEPRAALLQAEANLQQARARLESQSALTLPTAEASLAQAAANLQAAELDLTRTQDLVARNFYSQQKLDEAQRAVDVARAQRNAARAQTQANGRFGAERANAQAQLEAARAALDAARAKLAQYTVRAPGAGRVLVRSVDPGQIVQAGKALLAVSVQGPRELQAQVDERFLGQLQPGQHARVLADAYPGRPFDAKVDRLAPSVDAQSGSVEVTLLVAQGAPDFLREDMTLSVEVLTGERRHARVLPLRALRVDAAAASSTVSVLVAEDGRAVWRVIQLGLRTLSDVEVLAGLQDDDLVLLDPTIAPGARVRVRRVEPNATAPTKEVAAEGVGNALSQGFAR